MNGQIKVNGWTYSQKFRPCGNPDCKCHRGELHGPYWYATKHGEKLRYVGTKLPEHVTNHAKLLKDAAAQIKKLEKDLTDKRDRTFREYELLVEQLKTIQNLKAGEWVDPTRLIQLGLSQFNGHHE